MDQYTPGRVRRRRFRGSLIAAIGIAVSSAGGFASSGSVAAVPQAVERDAKTIPTDRIEPLDLACEGALRTGTAGIRCRWTVPTDPDAVGVKLIRVTVGSGEGRSTIFRTGDTDVNTFADVPVRPGVRYVYAVRAVDANGRIVGASRPVSAGVRPSEPATVEPLRLDCRQISGIRVSCEWTAPTAPGRVLTLWRSIDGAAREVVNAFSNPFATAYVDGVPNGTQTVAYAVVVTDGADAIVARSRADVVRLRSVDEPDVEVEVERVRPVPADQPRTAEPPATEPPVVAPPASTLPVDPSPVTIRPATTVPADTRPASTVPADTRPATTQPVEQRPVETRPAASEPPSSPSSESQQRPDQDERRERGAAD